ncbi:hypothetical protein [Rhizobium leguminosarum]|uniref:hypothetical protein n=1 Tax=Rhizobium leguminosarum TaxID=384 RepID=UPI0016175EEE|nr:hypothetical protein [Rhizobium leguminosarum]MBB4509567.1 hypothetical protein [Rhizobium leguminosarum]
MNWKRYATIALIIINGANGALAECIGILPAKDQNDRALLWRDKGRWKPMRELNGELAKGERRTVTVAYIAKDGKNQDPRRGVVVIKSGFTKPDPAPLKEVNAIALYRPWIKDPCRKRPYPEFRSNVDSNSYDDYHDRYLKTADDETFSQFHIEYESRSGCRYSDDISADAFFGLRNRSNRSQFSFDPKVVRDGPISHFATWLGIRSAYADQLVGGRQVQIRKYVADENGLACVKFRVTVGPGAFLRVNDLEKRTLLGDDGAAWQRE